MNTRQKGDYSEITVARELLRIGLRVAFPVGNAQGFDLLVESSNGGWKTLQVKTAYRRGARANRIYVDTIRGHGFSGSKRRGYVAGSFDLLAAVLPDEQKFWMIPFAEMIGRRCLTIDETRDSGFGLI